MADKSMSVTSYPASSIDSDPSKRQKFPTWFVITLGTTLAAILCITFILFKLSEMEFPEVRIETLQVSNLSVSINKLTPDDWLISGDWDAQFVVRNPSSKLTMRYDRIEAQILYESHLISKTAVPRFVLGAKSETAIRVTSIAPLDRDSIGGEWSKEIKFDGIMLGRAKRNVRGGIWKTLSFHCRDLPVAVSATGNGGDMVGGSKKCKLVIDNNNHYYV